MYSLIDSTLIDELLSSCNSFSFLPRFTITPTGDGLEEVQSSDSSSSSNEDETITVQTPADQSTDKKMSKKKRVKKKKWRKKKKTFVFPEQLENIAGVICHMTIKSW
jgi:hypothetical protein